MHEHSTSSMTTARMEGRLHVAKGVSAVNSVICNIAWLKVPVVTRHVDRPLQCHGQQQWAHINKGGESAFFWVHTTFQSTFSAEHMVCWTGVQYPHWLCVTGLLRLAQTHSSSCVICNMLTSVGHIESFYFCCLRLCYAQIRAPGHSMMTVICMQLLHVVHVQSLRLAPKCHALIRLV